MQVIQHVQIVYKLYSQRYTKHVQIAYKSCVGAGSFSSDDGPVHTGASRWAPPSRPLGASSHADLLGPICNLGHPAADLVGLSCNGRQQAPNFVQCTGVPAAQGPRLAPRGGFDDPELDLPEVGEAATQGSDPE